MNQPPDETPRDGNAPRAPSWLRSDAFPRIFPFALFMVFVAASSYLPPPVPVAPGEFDTRWLYGARAILVGVVLLFLWPRFDELRSSAPLRAGDWGLALLSGIAVLIIWIPLDSGWVTFALSPGFDPRAFGLEAIDWPITALRLLGLAVVVPVIEELFWRSFIMRWLEKPAFLNVDPATVGIRALMISSVLFALEHSQWLAGFIAGVVYGWIYMRTGKLWVPIIAHAVTNGLLGVYILYTHDWRFW